MKYGLGFTFCGLLLVAVAIQRWPWGALWLWPAVAFILVGAAYLGLGVRVFGKRADGRLSWWSYLLLGPYLVYSWILWRVVVVAFARDKSCHQVAPGVWLSRRPRPIDLPSEVRLVVDLTSEFSSAVATSTGYRAFPILDAGVPEAAPFLELVEELGSRQEPLLIHCAQGHGRTGTLAAALLVRRGVARDCEAALEICRTVRPGVRLNGRQRAFLAQIAAQLPPSAAQQVP
jgi:protein-tyrosine phosphatase